MKSDFLVREATQDDREKIKEIIDLSFPRFFRYFANQSILEPDEPLIVSEGEGVIAGFAKLIEFHVGKGKFGCILWLAVHPAYRRRGVALTLTVSSVEYLRAHGAIAVFASTQRRNPGALATLSKANFKQAGFLGLCRLFGFRLISFYRQIWYAPGEVVLTHA